MTGDKAGGAALLALGAAMAVWSVVGVLLGEGPDGAPATYRPDTAQGGVWVALGVASVAGMAYAAWRARSLFAGAEAALVFWGAAASALIMVRGQAHWMTDAGGVDGAVWYALDLAITLIALHVGLRLWRTS